MDHTGRRQAKLKFRSVLICNAVNHTHLVVLCDQHGESTTSPGILQQLSQILASDIIVHIHKGSQFNDGNTS